MEKLTVLVQPAGHFRIEINLHEICQKQDVWKGNDWGRGVYVKAYPCGKNQLKRLFALICEYSDDDTIIQVQKYLDEYQPEYGQLFSDILAKRVTVNLRRYGLTWL